MTAFLLPEIDRHFTFAAFCLNLRKQYQASDSMEVHLHNNHQPFTTTYIHLPQGTNVLQCHGFRISS